MGAYAWFEENGGSFQKASYGVLQRRKPFADTNVEHGITESLDPINDQTQLIGNDIAGTLHVQMKR